LLRQRSLGRASSEISRITYDSKVYPTVGTYGKPEWPLVEN
jgi:hypothetical protein